MAIKIKVRLVRGCRLVRFLPHKELNKQSVVVRIIWVGCCLLGSVRRGHLHGRFVTGFWCRDRFFKWFGGVLGFLLGWFWLKKTLRWSKDHVFLHTKGGKHLHAKRKDNWIKALVMVTYNIHVHLITTSNSLVLTGLTRGATKPWWCERNQHDKSNIIVTKKMLHLN